MSNFDEPVMAKGNANVGSEFTPPQQPAVQPVAQRAAQRAIQPAAAEALRALQPAALWLPEQPAEQQAEQPAK